MYKINHELLQEHNHTITVVLNSLTKHMLLILIHLTFLLEFELVRASPNLSTDPK